MTIKNGDMPALEQEFKDAKLSMDCIGISGSPSDPVKALQASLDYKKAAARYFAAKDALLKALEADND